MSRTKKNKDAKKAVTKAPPLPKHWPISTQRPSETYSSSDQSDSFDHLKFSESSGSRVTLEPGRNLLSCNGSDVQLARGASAHPNLDKGKGRFLIVLPGLMSFKDQAKEKAAGTPGSGVPETPAELGSGDETGTGIGSSSRSDSGDEKKPDRKADVVEKPVRPSLGKLENLGTDKPVLRIPFPDDRQLVLKGKKMESTSKFMMLTCKGNKGKVTCKDIFTSVIVFGDASWETGSLSLADEAVPVENGKPLAIKHYGGSDRTVDGGGPGIATNKARKMAAASRKVARVKEDKLESHHSNKLSASLGLDDSSDEDGSGSEEEYLGEVGKNSDSGLAKRRQTPRRSTSNKPVKYVDLVDTDGEDTSQNCDQDDTRKSAVIKSTDDDDSSSSDGADEELENGFSGDDSASSSEDDIVIPESRQTKAATRNVRKRKSSSKQSHKQGLSDESSEDSDYMNDSDNGNTIETVIEAKTRRQSKNKNSYVDLVDSDIDGGLAQQSSSDDESDYMSESEQGVSRRKSDTSASAHRGGTRRNSTTSKMTQKDRNSKAKASSENKDEKTPPTVPENDHIDVARKPSSQKRHANRKAPRSKSVCIDLAESDDSADVAAEKENEEASKRKQSALVSRNSKRQSAGNETSLCSKEISSEKQDIVAPSKISTPIKRGPSSKFGRSASPRKKLKSPMKRKLNLSNDSEFIFLDDDPTPTKKKLSIKKF